MSEFLFVLLILSPMFYALSRVQKEDNKIRTEAQKKEEDRLAKLKTLYPEPSSYEERMGVTYGPSGAQKGS